MNENNKIIITVSIFLIIISATIYSTIVEKKEKEYTIDSEKKIYDGPKILISERICRDVFDKYLSIYKELSKSETERLSEYTIKKIEIKKEKSDKTELVCVIKYDVRPFTNSKDNKWANENGKYQDDWIKDKTCFLVIDKIDGEYKIIKNVATLDLSSINLPNKIKYLVLKLV
jgi:hypothetical protein